jgi:transposase InsO family protein
MSLPIQAQSQLYHFKSRILALVAAQVFSVVMVSRLFGISRKIFYKYRQQAAQGRLASCDYTPHVHGSAKPQHIIDAVLHAKAHYPNFGKQRLANILYHQGIVISPNTVQRIVRQHAPPGPPVTCPPCHWSAFEALAPHALWAMDICYLYTRKHDGFDRYLITILDDHSRTVIASGLYERQTVSEVVEVLKNAVLTYGVPQRLVCDRGSQFTCSEFRRVCAVIQLAVDYAPPQYPQYKGKIERFFRTARSEMPRAQVPELATGLHALWIEEYNHDRIHSRVTDAAGHAQVPAFRLHWKPSAARPLPPAISVDDVFQVQRPCTGPHTRQVNAARCIRYRKQTYHFPELHKGDVIEINAGKNQIDFFYLGKLMQSIRKPLHQQTATTRKVQNDGLVKFKQRRIQLDLPKGTYIVVLREGQDYIFYLGKRVVFRMTGQEKCHPCI